jgi:hypothetical protein
MVSTRLLDAQVVKRYCRRRVAAVRQHALRGLGRPEAYRDALYALGFSGRIQTARFAVERLNLTSAGPW